MATHWGTSAPELVELEPTPVYSHQINRSRKDVVFGTNQSFRDTKLAGLLAGRECCQGTDGTVPLLERVSGIALCACHKVDGDLPILFIPSPGKRLALWPANISMSP